MISWCDKRCLTMIRVIVVGGVIHAEDTANGTPAHEVNTK